ncbi:thermonuclease family protein [Mucilaginibacter agri]|uniref:Nuclease n=1 Tax=Mucilaginibacter agri TaxID=2695265 RepID=A0A966DTH3_9SPHI|nr:thermonuclease family protein [Mucilaginibacter agri]NCD71258.1 nuclease [Mucilaginibacter agri]
MFQKLKSYKRLSLVLLISFVFGCTQTEPDLLKVVKIKDGDTIVVLTKDNQMVTVRLAEIDCPEKSQAFGQAAKQFTSDLCFGKGVKLQGNEHDRYGRTIALVILENGTNVNYELVKNGYAWQYSQYSKNNAMLAGYQQQAQQQRLGLWRDTNPTPPWEFRKGERELKQTNNENTHMPRKHRSRKRKSRRDTIITGFDLQ